MATFVVGTSLLIRAHTHVRICLPLLYGDAPGYPRVWAHHSPPPKRNLRKTCFFEVSFFFGRLNSTQFYCFYSILLDFDSILLDSTQFYWIQDPTSIPLDFDSILLNNYKSQITTTHASDFVQNHYKSQIATSIAQSGILIGTLGPAKMKQLRALGPIPSPKQSPDSKPLFIPHG